MENNNCTIFMEIFICKTKYSIQLIIHMLILERDNSGGFRDEKN